ncbi:MAG: FadR/GntR family transcriptional regulator [Alphaproteobacteria bacterium]|nr:FadR/GntR family transcriptional regulator [Alphaproteobacteria bacterium]
MTENAHKNDAPEPSQSGFAAIATRLQRAILDGKYPYQTKLPPERELAEFFAASRGTIRSALRQLEDLGLLARRVGSGTFVIYKTNEILSESGDERNENIVESISPLELIESRLAMEPRMAQLAVLNATAQDLNRMRTIVEQLEKCAEDSDSFSRNDEDFHLFLAAATHNRLIYWLYKKLNEVRAQAQWNTVKGRILKRKNIEDYNQEHRALYEALVNRNAESARNIMIQHLEHARQDLERIHAN